MTPLRPAIPAVSLVVLSLWGCSGGVLDVPHESAYEDAGSLTATAEPENPERGVDVSQGTDASPPTGEAGAPASPDGGAGTPPVPPSTPTSPPPPETQALPDALSVRTVSAVQSLVIPLGDGRVDPPVPILTRKPTKIRVAMDALPSWTPQSVSLVVEADGQSFAGSTLVQGSSDEARPATCLEVLLPPAAVTETTQLRVRLLTAGSGPAEADRHPATWPPAGGTAPLVAEASGRLRLVLFPVRHVRGARLNEVHLTEARAEAIRQSFLAKYPVSEDQLTIEVRPTFHHNAIATLPCEIWDEAGNGRPAECFPIHALLDRMSELHAAERADFHTVYVGLFSYDPAVLGVEENIAGVANAITIEDLEAGAVPLAATAHYPDDLEPGQNAAEAIFGTWDEYLVEFWADYMGVPQEVVREWAATETREDAFLGTLHHEVGHTLTMGHVSTLNRDFDGEEVGYPNRNGSIGLTGHDMRTGRDRVGQYTFDFMSYEMIEWVSDHTTRRLHGVLTRPGVHKAWSQPAPHLVALVGTAPVAGAAASFDWRAPRGPSLVHMAVEVVARSAGGGHLATVTGRLVPFSHGPMGHLFVPEVAGAASYEANWAGVTVRLPAALDR